MNDNEIIKAMQQCNGWNGRCLNCPLNSEGTNCKEKLNSYALELINRQKAENERLEKELEESNKIERENELQALEENNDNAKLFLQAIQHEKSEAIKEFAEKLKEIIYTHEDRVDVDGVVLLTRIDNSIDNLVKEMTDGGRSK